MSSTKTTTVLDNNVTLTAGAGNHTSSVATLTNTYGSLVLITITNGATGPTVTAQSQIQVSNDNSNWVNYGGALLASLANSAVTSWAIPINIGAQYLQVVSGSNTVQNVTLRVEIGTVTKI